MVGIEKCAVIVGEWQRKTAEWFGLDVGTATAEGSDGSAEE